MKENNPGDLVLVLAGQPLEDGFVLEVFNFSQQRRETLCVPRQVGVGLGVWLQSVLTGRFTDEDVPVADVVLTHAPYESRVQQGMVQVSGACGCPPRPSAGEAARGVLRRPGLHPGLSAGQLAGRGARCVRAFPTRSRALPLPRGLVLLVSGARGVCHGHDSKEMRVVEPSLRGPAVERSCEWLADPKAPLEEIPVHEAVSFPLELLAPLLTCSLSS